MVRSAPALLLLLAACATVPAGRRSTPARPSVPRAPTSLEASFFEDAADRRLDRFTLAEAALIVAGTTDEAHLAAAREKLRAALAPLEALPRTAQPLAQGDALLRALHQGLYGEGLLRRYELEASTLLDVLETGRFNCVSATVLYLVAAQPHGLDVRPVLTPSHARAALSHASRRVTVETTSPAGFDASPEVSRQVAQRFAVQAGAIPLFADQEGTEVDALTLLGAAYLNLANERREAGDLEGAEAFESRADRLVDARAQGPLRRVRVSTLGQLGLREVEQGRVERGLRLFGDAARLAEDGPDAAVARHNVLAAGMHRLEQLDKEGAPDGALTELAGRFADLATVHPELRGFALQLLARRRDQRGDVEGAVAAMREAAALGRGTRQETVLAHNLRVAELRQLKELGRERLDEAWQQWRALGTPSSAELARSQRALGAELAFQRARRAVQQRPCVEADPLVAEWVALSEDRRGGALRAQCRQREGKALWDAKEFAAAAAQFAEAERLDPAEPAHRKNRVAALSLHVQALVQAQRCSEALEGILEGTRLAPEDRFFFEAGQRCGLRHR